MKQTVGLKNLIYINVNVNECVRLYLILDVNHLSSLWPPVIYKSTHGFIFILCLQNLAQWEFGWKQVEQFEV